MGEIQDIDETEIFIKNLDNIVRYLKLNKKQLNKKLGWPTNKLSNILSFDQEPLVKDVKQVRTLLELETSDLLTRILNVAEIENLADKLSDIKLTKTAPMAGGLKNPISYIIVLLDKKYKVEGEFTKKEIINAIPSRFAKYSIEWEKTRLKRFIKKVNDAKNVDNNIEHIFKLTQELPSKMVEKAIVAVGIDWLEM